MLDIIRQDKDLENYFYVTYAVESSKSLIDAAMNIAIGQSIGNPSSRSIWETDEMIERYCAKIIHNSNFNSSKGTVEIGYPLENINFKNDGFSQLLCMIQGGQTDIDTIRVCRVVDIEFSQKIIDKFFMKPKHGITGFRKFTGQYNKPLFGGIIKPKTGITPHQLLDMTKQLVDGGVDFIKEDEILGDVDVCPLKDRVELISNFIRDTKTVYCFCINSDPAKVIDNAKLVANAGGSGIHVNMWSGFGVYKSIRELDTDLYIHMQKSGDKVITHKNNPFGINWSVICKLMAWSGVDTIHNGMLFGYLDEPLPVMKYTLDILRSNNVVPALSCGLTADLIRPIVDEIGVDWLANAGGSIHSHSGGSTAGALAIRNAIDAIKG